MCSAIERKGLFVDNMQTLDYMQTSTTQKFNQVQNALEFWMVSSNYMMIWLKNYMSTQALHATWFTKRAPILQDGTVCHYKCSNHIKPMSNTVLKTRQFTLLEVHSFPMNSQILIIVCFQEWISGNPLHESQFVSTSFDDYIPLSNLQFLYHIVFAAIYSTLQKCFCMSTRRSKNCQEQSKIKKMSITLGKYLDNFNSPLTQPTDANASKINLQPKYFMITSIPTEI